MPAINVITVLVCKRKWKKRETLMCCRIRINLAHADCRLNEVFAIFYGVANSVSWWRHHHCKPAILAPRRTCWALHEQNVSPPVHNPGLVVGHKRSSGPPLGTPLGTLYMQIWLVQSPVPLFRNCTSQYPLDFATSNTWNPLYFMSSFSRLTVKKCSSSS